MSPTWQVNFGNFGLHIGEDRMLGHNLEGPDV
jgi:hypothetical protein